MIQVVQALAVFLLVIQIGFAQKSDVYFQFSNQISQSTFPEGGFDQNGNLIVCADDQNSQRVLLLKYDTIHELIDSVAIPCAQGGCSMNNALVTNTHVYVVVQERRTWAERELRLLVFENDFKLIQDTIFEPAKWQQQYSEDIIENQQSEIIITSTLAEPTFINSGTGLYKFSKTGKLEQSKILSEHWGSRINSIKDGKYLLAVNSYTDTSKVKYSDFAVLLNSKLEIEQYIRTDSSIAHIKDFSNNLQINYSPSNYDHTSVSSVKSEVMNIVSTFDVDSFSMTDPTINFKKKIVLRVAQTTFEDSLISEYFFSSDSVDISSVYKNTAYFSTGSMLVFGVKGVSTNYDPLIPFNSSFMIAKFDKVGEHKWTKTYSEKNNYYHGSQIVTSNTGRIALIGTSFDFSNSKVNYINVLFLDSNGVLEKNSSIGINEEKRHTIKMFPNPMSNQVIVEMAGHVHGTLIITNSIGQKVLSTILDENSNTINVNDQPAGVYFYQITGADQQLLQSGKLVKH